LTHTGFEPHGLTKKATRLYPPPAREIPAEAIYEDLELPPKERQDFSRPYVVINMVSSVDGKAAIEGKASSIGDRIDRRAMRTLRSKADAVMIGANTLRAEKLALGLDGPVGARQPLAVIVSSTANVPVAENLISHEHQRVLLITTRHVPDDRSFERVLRAPATPSDEVDLDKALKLLKAEYAVEVLLVEGGPRLNHALISQDLVNELFLTLAPRLLGGSSEETLTILDGPVLAPRDANLLCAHLVGDELFLRYRVGHR
jgi:2,5-diamino-6-(ribosylamino)-4(3H)-pyrimidinone 5'-phosphate reductase